MSEKPRAPARSKARGAARRPRTGAENDANTSDDRAPRGTARGAERAGADASGAGDALDQLSQAIEEGAGLPAVARAASRALGTSVALIDRSSTVLAVAAASSSEEDRLVAGGEGVESLELRVADTVVGELRHRSRGEASPAVLRIAATLLGLELERSRAPEWADDEAAAELVRAVLDRQAGEDADVADRALALGLDLAAGAGVVVARIHPQAAQSGDWRARALTVATRALRSGQAGALAAIGGDDRAELEAIVAAADGEQLARTAASLERELAASLKGFAVVIGHSRRVAGAGEIHRAGREATLAANVAEAEGRGFLAFDDTGSYRLLLPAMSEDPAELERFYEETVAPLVAYDEQYETELVTTVEAYLENDGNVTPTAETLFTHRHTIRYRLERVRELSGHDMSSTEGREKLSLGLKSMRVLGISPARGPALEPGSKGGKVSGQG